MMNTRRPRVVMACASLVLLSAVMTNRPAAAQDDTARGEELSRRAGDRLRALHREADQLVGEARTLLGQLRRLELSRQIANEALRQARAAVEEAAGQLESLNQQVAELELARDRERPLMASRFSELYKLGRGRYLRMLLSTTDLRRMSQAGRTVATVAARDRARVEAYESRLVELETSRVEVLAKGRALEARRTEAVQAQAAASQALAAQAALIRQIDERRDLNARLVGELQAAQEKLEMTLATVGATPPTALPIGPFRGALPWPVAGTPVRRGRGAAAMPRPSLDIQASEGDPVLAVHDGVVAFAGSFDGLGHLVILDHGEETFSLYGHLLELAVGRGAPVKEGQAVGRIGTATSGAPTLYFELRVNGRPVEPLSWLGPR